MFSLTEDIPFSHGEYFFPLTERTEFTEPFGAHFEPTERLRHTEFTEAFQLTLAVTLCDICMPKAFCEIETVRKNAQ